MKRVKLPELYLETMASILRRKTGSSDRMTPRQMLAAADSIVTSGDVPVIVPPDTGRYDSAFTLSRLAVHQFTSTHVPDTVYGASTCEEVA